MARGVRPTAEVAIRAGFKWIQFAQAGEDRVADILAYMNSLRPEPSPYLIEARELTAAAQRGKKLFEGKTRCAECHSPSLYTDLKSYDVGTFDPQFNNSDGVFDTPTLAEIWRTGPYLHDGRAVTLREVFVTHNVDDQHGVTSNLTEDELQDLFAYLLSL
jgi:cytochrome c peroxidase